MKIEMSKSHVIINDRDYLYLKISILQRGKGMGKDQHIARNSGNASHEMKKPKKHHDHHAMMLADFKKRFGETVRQNQRKRLRTLRVAKWIDLHKNVSFPGDLY